MKIKNNHNKEGIKFKFHRYMTLAIQLEVNMKFQISKDDKEKVKI